MAFSAVPNTWLDNWSENGTNISVPIATFPELTAPEANATTGDIRKIVFALQEKLWTEWNERASTDRPTKWTLSKNASVNTGTGVTTVQYVHTIYLQTTAQEVAAET